MKKKGVSTAKDFKNVQLKFFFQNLSLVVVIYLGFEWYLEITKKKLDVMDVKNNKIFYVYYYNLQ